MLGHQPVYPRDQAVYLGTSCSVDSWWGSTGRYRASSVLFSIFIRWAASRVLAAKVGRSLNSVTGFLWFQPTAARSITGSCGKNLCQDWEQRSWKDPHTVHLLGTMKTKSQASQIAAWGHGADVPHHHLFLNTFLKVWKESGFCFSLYMVNV